jgi:hypothetical protein
MVLHFQPVQEPLPHLPEPFIPDFSARAIRDVFVPVAGAIEADVYNTRSLQERERACRLIALKERVQALEHEVARWNDLIGYELNLMGKDS